MKPFEFIKNFSFKDISPELTILGLAFFIYYLPWGMISPYMPLYFYHITGSYSGVGLITGIMFLLQIVIFLPLGKLADRIGRKKLTIFSLLNYLVVGPLYWLSNSFIGLTIARIWNSFSASGLWVGAQTMVRDFSKKNKEASSMGFFNFATTISSVIGPLLASFLILYLPVRNLFLLLPVSALMASALIKKLPEPKKTPEKIKDGLKDLVTKDKIFLKESKDYLSSPENLKISFLHFVSNFNFSVVMMILPLLIIKTGAALWQVGIVYSFFYLPFLSELKFGQLSDKYGRKKLMLIGFLLSSLFFFLLFQAKSVPEIFLLVVLTSVGLSMVGPSIQGFITRLSRGKEGEITGIYQSIGALGYGTGPFVAGFIADLFSLGHVFLLCAFLSLLMALFLKFFGRVNSDIR